jgi:CzcA family heavy metal efflux pump
MNLAQWAAHHRRSVLFLLAVAAIGGALSALNLPVALFPRVSFPRIAIAIEAGDRPAALMVTQVTRPVEEAIKAVPGLQEVRSTTSRGSAEISLNFDWGRDMSVTTLQVQSEIARIQPLLPAGTTLDVRRMDPFVFPVAAYSLVSDKLDLTKIRAIAQYELLPLLSSIPGVARVEVLGGTQREIRVDADPASLASHGLALADVSNTLSAANVLEVVGRTEDRHKLLLALSDTQLKTLDDVRQIIVRGGPNGPIRLSDVARVYESSAPNWTIVTADGHPAVLVQVKQQPDGNTVQILKDTNAALAAYIPKLPPSIRISNWYDQSELVTGAARSVLDAVLIGIFLAALVLLVFLRSFKITFITMIFVPAVLSTTVLLLTVLGMSFNIMTLGGMAAAIGLIIDDAIVMIEQIEKRLQKMGANRHDEIRAATTEFLTPLAGSSGATIIIFVPLAFLTGVTGAFFKALSITLASSLVVSFLAAFFVIPLLADHFIKTSDVDTEAQSGPIFGRVLSSYRSLFGRLQARPSLALSALVVLIVAGSLAYRQVGSGFMPSMDEGGFILDYISPPGTSLTDTDALLQQVERILHSTPEVLTYSRRTGLQLGGGLTEANTGDLFIRLKPFPRRNIEEVMSDVRARIAKEVPGLNVEFFQLMEDLIGDLTAVPQPIEIKIFGDDSAALNRIAPRVAAAITQVAGVTEIRDGVVLAGDALDIQVDAIKASIEGLDSKQIAQQVQAYLSGTVATQIQSNDRSVDVRVWLPSSDRTHLNDIREFRLTAPDGHKLALSRVAEIGLLTGQPQIKRDNLKPMVAVTARIEGRDIGGTVGDVKVLLDKSNLFPQGTYYELGGLYAQQQIAFQGLTKVLIAAFALVFLLLLYLYERFIVALTIIAMPLAAIPAVFIGLWATGIELNISAMMGMTMVVGIVTEIAIFYFSEYQSLTRGGMTHEVTLIEAGTNRFRPILMTTIAAVLALLPLAFALGQGSAMQQPLAVAIISGLAVQVPLVLLVMPTIYSVWNRWKIPRSV